MIKTDEDALTCDFAENYGIYSLRSLPLSTAAVLAAGLGNDSRIKLKMSGSKYPINTLLLAAAVDRLSYLFWAKTEDGRKGRRKPKLISEALNADPEENNVRSFRSAKAFKKRREEILKEIQNGNADS